MTWPDSGARRREFDQDGIVALSDTRWLTFVQSQSQATVFHHPAWAGALARTYGYRPLVLTLTTSDGRIVGGIPLLEIHSMLTGWRFVSLPFTDCCPPLAADPSNLASLTARLMEWREGVGAGLVEIRGRLSDAVGANGKTVAVQHKRALEADSERVFRSFKRTQVQQRITKAARGGVRVRFSRSRADLLTFYRLHLLTRRRLGAPVQPKRFLSILWEELIEAGMGFLILAYKDERAIAGALFLAWNGTLIYKYSASDPAYWKFRPNNLVLWRAIQWGCENGYREFSLGRSDLEDIGLRNFKDGWGTTEEPLVYSYLGDVPTQRTSIAGRRVLAGVIRHSPAIVCRGIGEVLYGHFG